MKVVPLNDKVLVKRLDAEEKTSGGILLPDSAREKPRMGKVMAVGTGKALEGGKRAPAPEYHETERERHHALEHEGPLDPDRREGRAIVTNRAQQVSQERGGHDRAGQQCDNIRNEVRSPQSPPPHLGDRNGRIDVCPRDRCEGGDHRRDDEGEGERHSDMRDPPTGPGVGHRGARTDEHKEKGAEGLDADPIPERRGQWQHSGPQQLFAPVANAPTSGRAACAGFVARTKAPITRPATSRASTSESSPASPRKVFASANS